MDNPFSKVLGSLGGLFARTSDDSVVGIDIGASSIKVVQIKKKGGKAVLETYGAIALGPYVEGGMVGQTTNLAPEKVAEALVTMLKEAGVTTKQAVMSIPASASLIFTIELPPLVEDGQLATIVPTEARKYIPVPINEVALDWLAVPKSLEDGDEPAKVKTEVLVTAIHNDTIARYSEIAKAAQLEAGPLEIEIFSSIRSSFNRELGSVLVADMGARSTKLAVVDRGMVRQFHAVNRGAVDITQSIAVSLNLPFDKAEAKKRDVGLTDPTDPATEIIRSSLDYVLTEIQSVVLAYEKKYTKAIGKVILTGGGALLAGFPELARERLRADVLASTPFAKVETPAFLDDVLARIGPEFAVAVGLALRKLQ